ncbi:MAG TPA: carbohydrate kinase family protein [Candidatus Paceibacterota bacterium]|nr:carbohydrate kinase family protein [Candidatus Paceibacterota bacterium]
MEKQIDFLAIGDVVTEPFIRIADAEATCDLHGEHCRLCLRFGDKVPYESVEVCHAVGNSPNAAVSASRLGVNSYLISYIGDDEIGKGDLESLIKDNVNTEYMMKVPGMASNYHYVLWYDVDRTILVKHTEFPYSFPMNLPEPKWIYLSSLASNSASYHLEIAEYLKQHPNTKLAFQPGTFQMKLGVEVLKDIYARTEVFLCNVEEAQRILGSEEEDKIKLMSMLRGLGPKIVVMTDSINGAYAYDGTDAWFMPVYPHVPYERTGAGDAFSSTFTTALLLGKTIPEALMWAPINAMSVVLKVGAQKGLLTQEALLDYLKNAPADYKPKKIN